MEEITPIHKDDASGEAKQWFVMRDLTRCNAKLPAYQLLQQQHIRCFTPMVWRLSIRRGHRERCRVPFMHDLLFVYDTREVLDEIVERVSTFQYRFLRHSYREPMTVRAEEMERFIRAVEFTDAPRFYLPEEITPDMCNRPIRIFGGPLDGLEGTLVTARGSKVKRLMVKLTGLLAATVEVNPDYIQLIK